MKRHGNPVFAIVAGLLIFVGSAAGVGAQAYSVARANAYAGAKDWQGLVRYATAWTQAQPNSVDAWGELGNAYALGLNEPNKAIAPLKRCVTLDPNSAPAWHALGATYVMAKQYGDGVTAIKRAIAINPNQPTYYNNLAAAYSGGGAFKSAMATLDTEKPLAQRLNNANVWYVLGNAYVKLDDPNDAIPAYRALLGLKPSFAQGWTNLGAALQFSGDTAGAKAAYLKGRALGDALAGKNEAQLEAQLQAAAQAQHSVRAGGNPNVSHSYDYYHDVQAGVDISRQY